LKLALSKSARVFSEIPEPSENSNFVSNYTGDAKERRGECAVPS